MIVIRTEMTERLTDCCQARIVELRLVGNEAVPET